MSTRLVSASGLALLLSAALVAAIAPALGEGAEAQVIRPAGGGFHGGAGGFHGGGPHGGFHGGGTALGARSAAPVTPFRPPAVGQPLAGVAGRGFAPASGSTIAANGRHEHRRGVGRDGSAAVLGAAGLGLGYGLVGGYDDGLDENYGYGSNFDGIGPGYPFGTTLEGPDYGYDPDVDAVTPVPEPSADALGGFCETPRKTCRLYEPSLVGADCSCRGVGRHRSSGTVVQ